MDQILKSVPEPEQLTLEYKEKFCEDLQNFIEKTENELKKTCSYLGWNLNKLLKETNETFITCPFNDGHQVPERTIEKHLELCEWNALGYTEECKPLPESALPLDSPSTIKLDEHLQHKVLQKAKMENPDSNIGIDERLIPKTSDRFMSDFTADERKAMYEYVIANTAAPDIGVDIADLNKTEKTKSISKPMIELLVQERNLKRRRAKFRGVHTNKKSDIEILREIVQQQMEMYKEYVSEKLGIPLSDLTEDNSNSNIENKYLKVEFDSSSKDKYEEESSERREGEKYIKKGKEYDRRNDGSSSYRYRNDSREERFKEKYDRSDNSSWDYKYEKEFEEKYSSSRKFDMEEEESMEIYNSQSHHFNEKYSSHHKEHNRHKESWYNGNRGKNEYNENKWHSYESDVTNHSQNNFYTEDNNYNKSSSRKRDRSSSTEIRKESLKHKSRDHKSHKKHKKHHKHRRDKSSGSDNERSNKRSKNKKYKRRDRSRS